MADIVFTGDATPAEDGGVVFKALVDDRTVRCHISKEALDEHFGLRDEIRPLDAYEKNRDRIHAATAPLLQHHANDYLILRSQDVR